jgi:hypothetical protein
LQFEVVVERDRPASASELAEMGTKKNERSRDRGLGLECAGRHPCRHSPFGVLDQFLDETGYCITMVACKADHFRPGAGVEIESHASKAASQTRWLAGPENRDYLRRTGECRTGQGVVIA